MKETYYDGAGSATGNITKTVAYTYNTAGNILSETKTVGSTTTTKNYTYSTGDWKDLLTEIVGRSSSFRGGTADSTSFGGPAAMYFPVVDVVFSGGRRIDNGGERQYNIGQMNESKGAFAV